MVWFLVHLFQTPTKLLIGPCSFLQRARTPWKSILVTVLTTMGSVHLPWQEVHGKTRSRAILGHLPNEIGIGMGTEDKLVRQVSRARPQMPPPLPA